MSDEVVSDRGVTCVLDTDDSAAYSRSDNLRKHDGAAVLVAEGVEKLEDEPWKWRSKDRSKLVHA